MESGRALVTGAGNGIGRAVAIRLSEMGYNLILTSRNRISLEETASMCATEAKVIPADLSSVTEVESLAEQVQSMDRLDVLFYSHGVHNRGKFLDATQQDISSSLQLYLNSILHLDKALLPMLIDAKDQEDDVAQAIIYMGSVSSTLAMPNNGAYSMCKHALKAHADSLFEEVRETGVKVGTLFPGYINSRKHTHATLNPNKMIQVDDIVLSVEYMLRMGPMACVTGINLRPQFTPKVSSKSSNR